MSNNFEGKLEKIKQIIIECDENGLDNTEISKRLGMNNNKLMSYRKQFKIYKSDRTSYSKWLLELEKESEEYWKQHTPKPTTRLLQLLVPKYGEEWTLETLAGWRHIKNVPNIRKLLQEEYS